MHYMMHDRFFTVQEFANSSHQQIATLYVDVQTELAHATYFSSEQAERSVLQQNATTLRTAMLNAMERDVQRSLQGHYLSEDIHVRRMERDELVAAYTFDELLKVREDLQRILQRRDMQPSEYNTAQRMVIQHNIDQAGIALPVLERTAAPL